MAMQIYCRDKYASTTKESNILETLRKIQGETENRVRETIQRKRNTAILSKYTKMYRKRLFLQEENRNRVVGQDTKRTRWSILHNLDG